MSPAWLAGGWAGRRWFCVKSNAAFAQTIGLPAFAGLGYQGCDSVGRQADRWLGVVVVAQGMVCG
jgi:hypothetical protein